MKIKSKKKKSNKIRENAFKLNKAKHFLFYIFFLVVIIIFVISNDNISKNIHFYLTEHRLTHI